MIVISLKTRFKKELESLGFKAHKITEEIKRKKRLKKRKKGERSKKTERGRKKYQRLKKKLRRTTYKAYENSWKEECGSLESSRDK